jgi:23S rRNA-intervening sequence protein
MEKILRHQELEVYKKAFAGGMGIFELSKNFPKEERYALTDQIRRSSRSVCANIAEARRKRRYEAAVIEDKRCRRRNCRNTNLVGICSALRISGKGNGPGTI